MTDNEAVERVEILVNGEPLSAFRSIQVTAAAPGRSVPINIPVPLRPGTNVIVLNAHDRAGNVSQAVRTVVREVGAPPTVETAPRFRGQRWAVVIGISRYQNARKGIPNLRYADRDARAFYEFLKSPQGGAFTDDHTMFLTDERATYGKVRESVARQIPELEEADDFGQQAPDHSQPKTACKHLSASLYLSKAPRSFGNPSWGSRGPRILFAQSDP